MENSTIGNVRSVQPRNNGVFFDLSTGPKPKNGLFLIPIDIPNYDIIVSILVAATISNDQISVYCKDGISSDKYGIITYINLINNN